MLVCTKTTKFNITKIALGIRTHLLDDDRFLGFVLSLRLRLFEGLLALLVCISGKAFAARLSTGPFSLEKKQVYSLPFNTLWLTFLNKIILLSILMKREHLISKIFSFINSVVPNAPFLYPLKTSENLTVFWYFQRIEIGWIWNKWVNLQKFLALCTQFSLGSFFFSIGDKCYIFRFIHESMIERELQLGFRF